MKRCTTIRLEEGTLGGGGGGRRGCETPPNPLSPPPPSEQKTVAIGEIRPRCSRGSRPCTLSKIVSFTQRHRNRPPNHHSLFRQPHPSGPYGPPTHRHVNLHINSASFNRQPGVSSAECQRSALVEGSEWGRAHGDVDGGGRS